MASCPHVAVSISRKAWSFSFWPEAKEQLIQAVFCGGSRSELTQGTSQKDLVPVLPSGPGTVQPPSVKELIHQKQRAADAAFGMSHTGGCLLQPGFMPPPYNTFHLLFLLFFICISSTQSQWKG